MVEDNKLSEEDVKIIEEGLRDIGDEEIDNMPSNNGIEESDQSLDPITEDLKVEIDPNTGAYKPLNEKDVAKHYGISEEVAKMLEISPEDVLNIPQSSEDIEISKDFIIKNIKENTILGEKDLLSEEELVKLVDTVLEYKKCDIMLRDNINWFDKLPQLVKNNIEVNCKNLNNNSRATRKAFAQFFLGSVITDSGMDQMMFDFEDSMNKAFNMDGIMTLLLDENKTAFEQGLDTSIHNIENMTEEEVNGQNRLELIQTLKDIKKAYNESYTYEEFIKVAKSGKLKVKDFDVEKFHNRYVLTFKSLYKSSPFKIKDIESTIPVLTRLSGYGNIEVTKFIIAFVKYCTIYHKYSGNNVVDHTYMSYFISNILSLDLIKNNEGQEGFAKLLINNIRAAIRAVNNIKEEDNNE